MTASLTHKTVPRRCSPPSRTSEERLTPNPEKRSKNQFLNHRVTHRYRPQTRRASSTIPPINHQFLDQHPPSSTGDLGSNWSTNSKKLVGERMARIAERTVRRKWTTRKMVSPGATPTSDGLISKIGRGARNETVVTTHSIPLLLNKKLYSGGISA